MKSEVEDPFEEWVRAHGGREVARPLPVLQTIPAPKSLHRITLTTDEWTTVDPRSGHADLEIVTISFRPKDRSIDTKSLKVYMEAWRNRGTSIERLADIICRDVANVTGSDYVVVHVIEKPRGGWSIMAQAVHGKE